MSSFALPIPPRPLTGTASQAYGTLRYRLHVNVQTLSFGGQFKTRYIFAAGTLDQ